MPLHLGDNGLLFSWAQNVGIVQLSKVKKFQENYNFLLFFLTNRKVSKYSFLILAMQRHIMTKNTFNLFQFSLLSCLQTQNYYASMLTMLCNIILMILKYIASSPTIILSETVRLTLSSPLNILGIMVYYLHKIHNITFQ